MVVRAVAGQLMTSDERPALARAWDSQNLGHGTRVARPLDFKASANALAFALTCFEYSWQAPLVPYNLQEILEGGRVHFQQLGSEASNPRPLSSSLYHLLA